MPTTSPRTFSSGPPELPGLIAASVWMHVGEASVRDRQAARTRRADDADAHGVGQAERIADGHHPVARRHLRRIAELHFGQIVIRLLGQLDQRAVGQRVAADHLGLVADVALVTVEIHLDLGGALDDVVVGEDVAVLADDEAGAAGDATCSRGAAGRAALPPPPPPKNRSSRSSLPPPPPKNSVRSCDFCFISVRMLTTDGLTALAMLRNVLASIWPAERRAVRRRRGHRRLRHRRRRQDRAARRSPCRRPARRPRSTLHKRPSFSGSTLRSSSLILLNLRVRASHPATRLGTHAFASYDQSRRGCPAGARR